MIISKDTERAFDKNPTLLIKKISLHKLRTEVNFFNLMKCIYKKPMPNIIPDGETPDTVP